MNYVNVNIYNGPKIELKLKNSETFKSKFDKQLQKSIFLDLKKEIEVEEDYIIVVSFRKTQGSKCYYELF